MRPEFDVWLLDVDGHGTMTGHQYHTFEGYKLAPLTDPAADQFIERIKKLGREPITDAPKVTVTK